MYEKNKTKTNRTYTYTHREQKPNKHIKKRWYSTHYIKKGEGEHHPPNRMHLFLYNHNYNKIS